MDLRTAVQKRASEVAGTCPECGYNLPHHGPGCSAAPKRTFFCPDHAPGSGWKEQGYSDGRGTCSVCGKTNYAVKPFTKTATQSRAGVAKTKYSDEESPLDYGGYRPRRIALHEPGFSSKDTTYHPDDTSAFLDYTPAPKGGGEHYIHYVHVAPERRGAGLASGIMNELVSRDPKGSYDWGKVMEESVGNSVQSLRKRYPKSDHRMKVWY